MKYFFTSDTHYGHYNIIRHCNRPFANVIDMHKALIDNWNMVVGNGDVVYHLGDLALSSDLDMIVDILSQLKGTIRIVKGNHDKKITKIYEHNKKNGKDNIEWIDKYNEETFFVDGIKKFIVMSHYPFVSWNKSFHGSYNLHGHCHGNIDKLNIGTRRYDVGVDSNNFTPVELYQLIGRIEKQADPCGENEYEL